MEKLFTILVASIVTVLLFTMWGFWRTGQIPLHPRISGMAKISVKTSHLHDMVKRSDSAQTHQRKILNSHNATDVKHASGDAKIRLKKTAIRAAGGTREEKLRGFHQRKRNISITSGARPTGLGHSNHTSRKNVSATERLKFLDSEKRRLLQVGPAPPEFSHQNRLINSAVANPLQFRNLSVQSVQIRRRPKSTLSPGTRKHRRRVQQSDSGSPLRANKPYSASAKMLQNVTNSGARAPALDNTGRSVTSTRLQRRKINSTSPETNKRRRPNSTSSNVDKFSVSTTPPSPETTSQNPKSEALGLHNNKNRSREKQTSATSRTTDVSRKETTNTPPQNLHGVSDVKAQSTPSSSGVKFQRQEKLDVRQKVKQPVVKFSMDVERQS